jgi:hypothetical protein
MRKLFTGILAVGVGSLVVSGCSSGPSSRVKKGEMQATMDMESIRKNFIEVVGIGAADPALTNATQKKATSRNAAVVDGQYRLLSMVKGLRLSGGITVEKAIETDSKMQTLVDAEIKGAEEVKYEWTKDDGCVVTMRLDKKRLERLMGVQFE